MTKQEVIEMIQQAFANVPAPLPENLMQGGKWVIDLVKRGLTWDDQAGVASILIDKQWQEVNFEKMDRESAPLSMMTPEAVRYYLPGFLIHTLTHTEVANIDGLRWGLSPPPFGTSTLEEFKERCSLLTLPQQKAVAQYFEYVREKPEFDLMHLKSDDPAFNVTTYWRDNYLLPEDAK